MHEWGLDGVARAAKNLGHIELESSQCSHGEMPGDEWYCFAIFGCLSNHQHRFA